MSARPFAFGSTVLLWLACACNPGAGRIDTACRSNVDCAPDELCATGICEGGLGECEARPESCEDGGRQVCGCDGRTYENQCFASLNGVRVSQQGPCNCADNGECPSDQYCALEGSCSNVGVCEDRPDPMMCEPEPEVVCGCDFVTYGSPCLAASDGARVSALGECECQTNADCQPSEYCDAITCDGPGGCAVRPTSCPPPDEEPVTGCDGVIYPSACDAAAAGIRVRP